MNTPRAQAVPMSVGDAGLVFSDRYRDSKTTQYAAFFDGSRQDVSESGLSDWMRDRLDCAWYHRRRLHRYPGDLAPPAWVPAPDLVVENHVRVHDVTNWGEASEIIVRLLATSVDLDRPPWDVTLIQGVRDLGDGFPGRCSILVYRVHHAASDGLAKAETMRRMLRADPLPSSAPTTVPLASTVRALSAIPGDTARYLRALRQPAAALDPGEAPRVFPDLRFTQGVSGHPRIGFVEFPLSTVRIIRAAAASSTVNDVALTVIGGAMREFLTAIGEKPADSLHTLMPISATRRSGSANSLAVGVVNMHTDEADPLTRLDRVRAASQAEKRRLSQEAIHQLIDRHQSLPCWIARLAFRRPRPAPPGTRPATNIANVPSGLDEHAEFLGARILHQITWLPFMGDLSLQHEITSCGDLLAIAVTADSAAMPDIADYVRRLREEFARLVDAVERAGSAR